MMQFTVSDMVCQGCVRSITKAVERAAPGAQVAADLETRLVRIDAAIAPEALARVIAEAGFTVAPIG